MYLVNPPQINELTGEPEGEAQVIHREQHLGQHYQSDDNPAYDHYEETQYDGVERLHAEKAAATNIPALDPNANGDDLLAFWRGPDLTDAQIDAIQSYYVASDDEEMANLLAWKVTGNEDFLNDAQREDLEMNPVSYEKDLQPAQVDDLVFNSATEPNEQIAEQILQADFGEGPAEATVSLLAHQYYSGQITADHAYQQAQDSGIDTGELYMAFNKLYKQLK